MKSARIIGEIHGDSARQRGLSSSAGASLVSGGSTRQRGLHSSAGIQLVSGGSTRQLKASFAASLMSLLSLLASSCSIIRAALLS